jgi:hypothetical protein
MEDGSMMGLMVLSALVVYLLVSVFVTRKAANWAKGNNKKPWVWGGVAAFVMYNLVFWDLIPTLIMHKHYCDTQAGFWLYKSPEQWKAENPGVMETLKQSLSPDMLGVEKPTAEKIWLNQRFYDDIQRVQISHTLSRKETKFFDAKNGELLAKSVNFWRGKLFGSFDTLDELRQSLVLGWGNRQCDVGGKSPTDTFDQYIYQFWKSGENK